MIFSLNVSSPCCMKLTFTGSTQQCFLTSSFRPLAFFSLVASFSVVMMSLGDANASKASLMRLMSFFLKLWWSLKLRWCMLAAWGVRSRVIWLGEAMPVNSRTLWPASSLSVSGRRTSSPLSSG